MSTETSSKKSEMHDHSTAGEGTYEKVIIILAVFTALEFLVSSFISSGQFEIGGFGFVLTTIIFSLDFTLGVIILLSLAIIKVLLVALIFMHVKYEKNWLLIFAITFGLPIFLVLPIVIIPALG